MKTLANCTPREFAVQTVRITERLKHYSDRIRSIRSIMPELPAGASDEEKAEAIQRQGFENFMEIVTYVFGDSIDETMALFGDMCFMSGEQFASLDSESGDEDGLCAIMEIFTSRRVQLFFTTVLRLGKATGTR